MKTRLAVLGLSLGLALLLLSRPFRRPTSFPDDRAAFVAFGKTAQPHVIVGEFAGQESLRYASGNFQPQRVPSQLPGASSTSGPWPGLKHWRPPDTEVAVGNVTQLPGLVVSQRRTQLRTSIGGVIHSLEVSAGDCVEENQPLIVIDDAEIHLRISESSQRIAAAEAALAEAELNVKYSQDRHQVMRDLRSQRAAPVSEVLESEFEFKAAAARLRALQHRVSELRESHKLLERHRDEHIAVAPFRAVVTSVQRFPRQYVPAGEVVLLLESCDMWLKVQAPVDASRQRQPEFSLLHRGRRHRLALHRWEFSLNADGTRTAFLEMPEELGLASGQILEVCVAPAGEGRER